MSIREPAVRPWSAFWDSELLEHPVLDMVRQRVYGLRILPSLPAAISPWPMRVLPDKDRRRVEMAGALRIEQPSSEKSSQSRNALNSVHRRADSFSCKPCAWMMRIEGHRLGCPVGQ